MEFIEFGEIFRGAERATINNYSCVCDVSHVDAISNFHDYIIDSCRIAMTVHIPHTNSTGRKGKEGKDAQSDDSNSQHIQRPPGNPRTLIV